MNDAENQENRGHRERNGTEGLKPLTLEVFEAIQQGKGERA